MEKLNLPLKTIGTVVVALIILTSSVYTVNEGHIGIVKRFSEAKEQVNPGLHFKVPFIDSVEEIEVRTRKNEERMASSTK
jgi:regulator of protease activity HflC (stomatin/prohibitin superfamily)